jgi:hypothetical protein
MTTAPPLLQGGGPRAVDAFARELNRVLSASAADAAALHEVFERGPRAVSDDAVAASRAMLADAAALNDAVHPILAYVRDAPKPDDVMAAAEDVLNSTDCLLDSIENRLRAIYGIESVALPSLENYFDPTDLAAATLVAATPGTARGGNPAASARPPSAPGTPAALASLSRGSHSIAGSGKPHTPLSSRRRITPGHTACLPSDDVDVCRNEQMAEPDMPSTPNMLDFGIDDSALQGLAKAYNAKPASVRKQASTIAGGGNRFVLTNKTMDDDEQVYGQAVSDSLRALRIQTPVQVAERFTPYKHSPPSNAVVETPQQVSARIESRYGSSPSAIRRQALVFETPEPASLKRPPRSRTGVTSNRSAMKLRVEQQFETLPNFIRSKLPVPLLVSACNLLHDAHERADGPISDPIFLELSDITRIVAEAVGNDKSSLLVVALTKLEIFKVEKMPGTPTQYIFDGR